MGWAFRTLQIAQACHTALTELLIFVIQYFCRIRLSLFLVRCALPLYDRRLLTEILDDGDKSCFCCSRFKSSAKSSICATLKVAISPLSISGVVRSLPPPCRMWLRHFTMNLRTRAIVQISLFHEENLELSINGSFLPTTRVNLR